MSTPYKFFALVALLAVGYGSYAVSDSLQYSGNVAQLTAAGQSASTATNAGSSADLVAGRYLYIVENDTDYTPTLAYTVHNTGGSRAVAFRTRVSYSLASSEDGAVETQDRVSYFGLNAGQAKEFMVSPLRDGIDLLDVSKITVSVDTSRRVSESSEVNNVATFLPNSLTNAGALSASESYTIVPAQAVKQSTTAITPQTSATTQTTVTTSGTDTMSVASTQLTPKNPYERQEPNGQVTLGSVYPTEAGYNVGLVLRGTGFQKQGNIVVFDTGYKINVPSGDGKSIFFSIPTDRVPLCRFSEPKCELIPPYNPVRPGTYKIYVGNSEGWSKGVDIKVYDPTMSPKDRAAMEALVNSTTTTTGSTSGTSNSTQSSTSGTPLASGAVNYGSGSMSEAGGGYRAGLYFTPAWTGCMTRMGSQTAMAQLHTYLNAGQVPPPWSNFAGSDASNIATCETEAGWTWENYSGSEGYSGSGSSGSNYTAYNWKNHTWTFKDGSTQQSSILDRSDTEYTSFIASLDSSASQGYFGGWMSGAGDQSNWQQFGVPVISQTQPEPGMQPYNTSSGGGGYTTTQADCEAGNGTWNTGGNYCAWSDGTSSAVSSPIANVSTPLSLLLDYFGF